MAERADTDDPERHSGTSSGEVILVAPLQMSRFSQYTKNVGALVGQAFIQRVVGMMTTMILARSLGVTSFAAYSIIVNTASSAYGLVRLGVDAAIHVHTAEGHDGEEGRRARGEMLAAGLLLLLLAGVAGGLGCLALAKWLAANVYGNKELAPWIRVAGLAVFLQCVSQFCYATMAGLHRFTAYARIMAVTAILNWLAITSGCLLAGLHGAVAATIGMQAVTVVWLAIVARTELRVDAIRLVFRNTLTLGRRLLQFGFPFYVAGLLSVPVTYYLQGSLVKHAGLEALGYLRAIMAMTTIVSFVPSCASAAMVSMLTSTRSQNAQAFADKTMRNIKMVFVFGLIMAILVNIALPWLMPILFGTVYRVATTAASIALISSVLAAVSGVIGNALFSARRVDLICLSTFLQMGTFLLLGSALIPEHGLIGYLTADMVGYFALTTVSYWRSLRWLRQNAVQVQWLTRLLIPFSLLATYTISHAVQDGAPSYIHLFVGVVGLVLCCIWGYEAILDKEERDVVYRLIGIGKKGSTDL